MKRKNKELNIIKILFFFLVLGGQASFSQTNTRLIDSIQAVLQKEIPDTIRVMRLNDLFREVSKNDAQRAVPIVQKALKLATKIQYKRGMARSYSNLGNAYYILGKYEASFESYYRGIDALADIKDVILLANIYTNLSNMYVRVSENQLSIAYLCKAIKIYEKERGSPAKVFLSNCYHNLGSTYTILQKYDSAKIFLDKSYQLRKKYAPEKLGSVLNALGKLMYAQKQYKQSYAYLKEALERPQSFGHVSQKHSALCFLAKNYIAMDSLDAAFRVVTQALAGAEKHKIYPDVYDAYSILSAIYAKKKDFELAYLYECKGRQGADSLQSESQIKAMARVEFKVYKQKKEWEHKQLQQKNEVQRYWLWFSTGTLTIIFLLLLYAVYSFYKKQKDYRTILQQSLHLEKASIEIALLNKELAEKVISQDKSITHKNRQLEDYLFINSHKVRSPLANILGLAEIVKNKQYNSHEELLIWLEHIYTASQNLDKILFEINTSLHEGLEEE